MQPLAIDAVLALGDPAEFAIDPKSAARRSQTAAFAAWVAVLAMACSSSIEKGSDSDLVALGAESAGGSFEAAVARTSTPRDRVARKLIRSGQITISLADLEGATDAVERIVTEAGGYVEQSHVAEESRARLQCRVPAARLEATMDAIGALGDERYRSVSAEDVTEEYADLEAHLRNDRALRDRLRKLLDHATKVEDVLAIEKELNRVQSGIEAMEGRLERLASQVELSALSVTLERERILGPLGYVGYGLWWAISKLFVIR
jgi:hypothetical protein